MESKSKDFMNFGDENTDTGDSDMNHDIKTENEDDESEDFTCPHCFLSFMNNFDLKQHRCGLVEDREGSSPKQTETPMTSYSIRKDKNIEMSREVAEKVNRENNGDIQLPNLQNILRKSDEANYETSPVSLPNLEEMIKKEKDMDQHICPVCFVPFHSEEELGKHCKSHTRNLMNARFGEDRSKQRSFDLSEITPGDYGCSVCKKTFEDEVEFIEHCKKHDEDGWNGEEQMEEEEGGVSGRSDGPEFTSKVLLEHSKMESGYTCEICDNYFSSKSNLETHIQCVHGDENDEDNADGEGSAKRPSRDYICTICLQKFTSPNKFLQHVKGHEGDEVHCCPMCFNTFKDQNELNIHCLEHMDGQQLSEYPCAVCGKIYRSPRALRVHLRKHIAKNIPSDESKVPQTPSKPSTEGQPTEVKEALKDSGRYGPTDQRPYVCPICQANFARKFFLVEHCRIHTGERPHKCPVCGKGFRQRFHLQRHQGVHTYQKPYRCTFPGCKKEFTRNTTLVEHTRTHNGERPFKCHHCEKCFTRRADVARHILTHNREKPYVCDICDKGFSQKSYLINHAMVHTGQSRYTCEICEKGFVLKSHLTYHLRTHVSETRNGKAKKILEEHEASMEQDFDQELGEDEQKSALDDTQ